MGTPVLMALDDHPNRLGLIRDELVKRYGRDYTIACDDSPASALSTLQALSAAGEPVAVVLAAHSLEEMAGVEFLIRAHALHPQARRALLVMRGDDSANPVLHRAMTLGHIDFFLPSPARPADEQFHRVIAEFLDEWTRETDPPFVAISIVAEPQAARSHELRDLFTRNGVPFAFHTPRSEAGAALLETTGQDDPRLPVLVMYDGQVMQDPTNERLGEMFGVASLPEGDVDLVVVGAGPAGLAAAVYAASQGLSTFIVEAEAIGGQAGTSSLIRNYLGFPRGLSGAELASRAFQQAWLFGAIPNVTRPAVALRSNDVGGYVVTLSSGDEVTTRSVILATGITYRKLEIANLDRLIGMGVYYGAATTEARAMEGRHVFVVGGANSAGQAAVYLAEYAKQVTMLVRGSSLAATMSDYLIKEVAATPNIDVRHDVEVVDGAGDPSLDSITLLHGPSGGTETVPATALFVLIGGVPRTGWLPDAIHRDGWGYIVTGNDLVRAGRPLGWTLDRAPMMLETSMPGVFAAGDARARSIKRVAAAVGEGSTVVSLVHEYLDSSR